MHISCVSASAAHRIFLKLRDVKHEEPLVLELFCKFIVNSHFSKFPLMISSMFLNIVTQWEVSVMFFHLFHLSEKQCFFHQFHTAGGSNNKTED